MKNKPNGASSEQDLRSKIDELEKALAYERMRIRAYENLPKVIFV